jgi:hypothetical protein
VLNGSVGHVRVDETCLPLIRRSRIGPHRVEVRAGQSAMIACTRVNAPPCPPDDSVRAIS